MSIVVLRWSSRPPLRHRQACSRNSAAADFCGKVCGDAPLFGCVFNDSMVWRAARFADYPPRLGAARRHQEFLPPRVRRVALFLAPALCILSLLFPSCHRSGSWPGEAGFGGA
eukprot:6999043-Pyramimonas_sp.AAC.1